MREPYIDENYYDRRNLTDNLLLHPRTEKEKDLGIPSKFPFKDQILAEAAELKVQVNWPAHLLYQEANMPFFSSSETQTR